MGHLERGSGPPRGVPKVGQILAELTRSGSWSTSSRSWNCWAFAHVENSPYRNARSWEAPKILATWGPFRKWTRPFSEGPMLTIRERQLAELTDLSEVTVWRRVRFLAGRGLVQRRVKRGGTGGRCVQVEFAGNLVDLVRLVNFPIPRPLSIGCPPGTPPRANWGHSRTFRQLREQARLIESALQQRLSPGVRR